MRGQLLNTGCMTITPNTHTSRRTLCRTCLHDLACSKQRCIAIRCCFQLSSSMAGCLWERRIRMPKKPPLTVGPKSHPDHGSSWHWLLQRGRSFGFPGRRGQKAWEDGREDGKPSIPCFSWKKDGTSVWTQVFRNTCSLQVLHCKGSGFRNLLISP